MDKDGHTIRINPSTTQEGDMDSFSSIGSPTNSYKILIYLITSGIELGLFESSIIRISDISNSFKYKRIIQVITCQIESVNSGSGKIQID